ncbi:cobalt/nickel transport protein [Desulfacinum hydrothermale DSM 13146]|uniref:Cobalt/nickel transport protein n=1 Tax=Desulfacinum hydrothermale DSM 13146 TaxID=1121390 RepID=A0A1W1X061_9BACT|nr:DUF4198 domain-containing protein [Desulfacinum hydrothermale]SMC17366.1 cobalt/nickel transport protein [Desulfacinum hydrothermale DSM 13146]
MRFRSRLLQILMVALALLAYPVPGALAHFGLILPSDDIISAHDSKTITVQAKFLHPFEGQYMEMAKPRRFAVMSRGKTTDLLDTLTPQKARSADQEGAHTYWETRYTIKRPGDYIFFVEPEPYWEPAEDKFIVHYTKVCVQALGLEEGWDRPVGLETEIIPLTRPYGLWTGNVFTGRVLLKGKPVPFAEVEVEYLNGSPHNPSRVTAPADAFVTQVIKADANGVFTYAMPRAGWWGFAALSEASWTLPKDGRQKPVEIGAVFWVHTTDMK